jgi:quercetin dioxygenase-like cupin family protein
MQITRVVAIVAAILAGVVAGGGPAAPAGVHITRPTDVHWQTIPGYPAGYERMVLEGKTDQRGPVTYRVRLAPHFRFEPHTHDWDEHVTILQGTWYVGFGSTVDEKHFEKLEAGSFAVIPGGTPHYVKTGDTETVAQVHGIGPVGLTRIGR